MEHEGHRQRMLRKFEQGGYMPEHELLEILLFNAYPRKNTNPVAHTLLETFGSMKDMFEADVEELEKIPGVGGSVALYLKCVAACTKPVYSLETNEAYLKNYGDFKIFSAKRLRSKSEEVLELYFLEKNGRVKYIYSRSDSELHRVTLDRSEVPGIFAAVKPFGVVIAHNHLMYGSRPSSADDNFTVELAALCRLHGVKLFDHCIYASDNDIFSYFGADRLAGYFNA